MILSDNETRVDLLNNEAIAKTIVTLLRERPEHPVTIGVHGDWGAGKSSVLEMIDAALSGNDRVLCLKFNSWRFQGFEDAKIALIEGIVAGLIEKRPILTKASEKDDVKYRRCRCPKWIDGYVDGKRARQQLQESTPLPAAMRAWLTPPITRSLWRTRPTHTETIARKTPIPTSQSS